jgi:hypothetical protein
MDRRYNRRGFTVAVMSFLGSIMGVVVGLPGVAFLLSPAAKKPTTASWLSLGALANYPAGAPTPFTYTTTKQFCLST